jgi:hypothetical protein
MTVAMRQVAVAALRSLVLGWLAAAAIAPGAAEGHRGDGIFTLVQDRRLSNGWYAPDIAMLPDGSVVGVMHARGWRITPAREWLPIPGLGGTGIAATADGGVVVLQGEVTEPFPGAFRPPVGEHRVVRWAPGAGVSVLAGTGTRGFAGDGASAREALLDLRPGRRTSGEEFPTGIVALPDGAVVFADVGNRRIRAIDRAGSISTIAGSDGSLRDPVGLAAMPDGGWLVGEAGWPASIRTVIGRVRRIAPDGDIETQTRLSANDVVVLADGTSILADNYFGQLWRLAPGSRVPVPYLRRASAAKPFDFAARVIGASRLALDPHGGLLAADSDTVTYLPRGETPWTLVALRDTRPASNGLTAVIQATRPGIATLEVVREERVIARVSQAVSAGHTALRAAGPIRPDWYDVRIALQGEDGAVTFDEVPVHGAPRLTTRLARKLLGRHQGFADPGTYELGDCHRFGKRRVDCAVTIDDGTEAGVVSITLARTGVVLRRHYRWSHAGFRRKPRFNELDGVQRLSRRVKGEWE